MSHLCSKLNQSKILENNKAPKKELVSIIILSFNDLEHLQKLLPSMYNQSYDNIEIIVIDNANNERVQEYIKNQPKVKLVISKENLGYSGGNNLGVKHANGNFIFILNSDTWLERNAIDELVKKAKENPKIGVVVPKVMIRDTNIINSIGKKLKDLHWGGIVTNIGGYEEDVGQYDEPKKVFSHDGAAFLVKREVINQVGLFDEVYFFMGETVDFTLHVNMAGYEIITCPSAVVHHYMEGSINKNKLSGSDFKLRHGIRNEYITIFKNYELKTILELLPLKLIHTFGWAIQLCLKKNMQGALQIIFGMYDFLWLIPYCIKKRKEISKFRRFTDREIFNIGRKE